MRPFRNSDSFATSSRLHCVVLAPLSEPDRGEQPVAEALAAGGLFRSAALGHELVLGLARAAVSDRSVAAPIGISEVTEIADALARDAGGRIAVPGDHLEREPRGRGAPVGADAGRAAHHALQHGAAEGFGDPRLVAVGEERADLDARCTGLQRLGEPLGPAGATRDPEREAERAQRLQIHDVASAVERLTGRGGDLSIARGSVVPAGGGPLDDEAIDAPGRLLAEYVGERVARHDGEETRSPHGGRGPLPVRGRIEAQVLDVPGRGVLELELQLRRLVARQGVEHHRDLARDAGPHEHVVHPGQHRAVEEGQVRHLDLGEQVDADGALVALPREVHLDERRQYRELLTDRRDAVGVHREAGEGLARRRTRGEEVALQRRLRDPGDGELGHGAPHVAAGVAHLKAAHEHRIDGGPRDDSQLSEPGHGIGETPVRDTDPHSPLDDAGEWSVGSAGGAAAVCHLGCSRMDGAGPGPAAAKWRPP